MDRISNAHGFVIEKPEGKRAKGSWEDNIKMDVNIV
jgi:hypothetical protein